MFNGKKNYSFLTQTPVQGVFSSWQKPELPGKDTFHFHSMCTAITTTYVFSQGKLIDLCPQSK